MELILFFLAMILLGSVLYLVACFLYFVITQRPVSLALKLCWKMAIGSILGLPMLGFGAMLLPTIMFNGAIEPLPNYSKWRDIIAGLIISTVVSVIMFLLMFGIAWEIFE